MFVNKQKEIKKISATDGMILAVLSRTPGKLLLKHPKSVEGMINSCTCDKSKLIAGEIVKIISDPAYKSVSGISCEAKELISWIDSCKSSKVLTENFVKR